VSETAKATFKDGVLEIRMQAPFAHGSSGDDVSRSRKTTRKARNGERRTQLSGAPDARPDSCGSVVLKHDDITLAGTGALGAGHSPHDSHLDIYRWRGPVPSSSCY
jgi:hypothetical protein